MSNPTTSLPPGFRFHPTDEELICHYLRNRAASLPCSVSIIAEVDIYKFDPWDLPAKALFGDREWYFFSPRDRKYPNGVRPNRAAKSGYWKATGTDKPISASKGNENIGVKKALVFYVGRPPRGVKTDWIMHEYRIAEARTNSNSYRPAVKLRDSSMRLDDWVLCRIYKKSSNLHSMDPEKEASTVKDGLIRTMPEATQQNNTLKLPKSYSLSELLEDVDYSALVRVLENQSDLPGLEHGSFGNTNSGQNYINNSNGHISSHQQLPQTEHPVFVSDNSLKRQRVFYGCSEDSSGLPHPSKKLINSSDFTNSTSQNDGPQYNLFCQPFFTQQLLLKSHQGLH